jgi:hypothetical protein
MANIFDQFDEEDSTSTEPNIFDQFDEEDPPEEPTVNPELVSYASELTSIQGGYEAADLEAAGFTNEEIQAYSDSIGQEMQAPGGDGSKLYLGVPGTDMYDGLKIGYKEDSFENREPDAEVSAFEIYNAYADNENTVIDPTTGNLTYNDPVSAQSFIVYYPARSGTSVPIIQDVWNEAVRRLRPDYYADKPAGVNEGTRLINEVTDSLTNTVEFVAALGDIAAGKVGVDTTFVEWTNTIPRTSSGFSKFDAVTGEGVGLAASFFTGKIVSDAAVEGGEFLLKRFMSPISKTSTWMKVGQPVVEKAYEPTRQLLKYSGGDLGVALGADTNTEAYIAPFDVDPTDPKAEQILAARMNIFVDSLIMSGVMDTALKVGLKTADFVNEASVGAIARSLFEGDGSKMTSAMDNILSDLSAVQASSTKQDMETARQQLIEVLRKNSTLLIDQTQASKQNNDLVLDVFSALEAGEAVTPQTQARIQQIRSGIVSSSKNQGALNQQANAINVQTDRILQEEADAALPVGSTMGDAVEGIVGSNDSRILKQQRSIFEAEEAIKTDNEAALNSILSDPNLSPALSRLGKVSSSEVSALSVAKKKEIATTLIDEAERMTKQKNDLFNAIPEGARFDYEGFGNLIDELSTNLDQFGTEGAEFLQSRLVATIKAAYKKAKPGDEAPSTILDQFGNPVTKAPTDIADLGEELFEAGVDFKRLYNDIRPAISALAEEAYNSGKGPVGTRLRSVVKYIDDQVEFVANNNPEAKDAATNAMNYYKRDFIPLWGDAPLTDTYQTFKDTRGRGINPVAETTQSQGQVTNILESGASEEVGQLVKALEVSDLGASPETVQEYIVARTFEDLYAQITKDGINNIDPATLSATIRGYADQMRGNFDTLAMELDLLESRIKNARQTGESVSDTLVQAQEQFAAMQNDAFSKLISGFVDDFVPGMPSANVENKITSMLNSSNGADSVKAILEATDNNPVVQGGLKKLYLQELREKAFTAGQTSSGAPITSVAKVRNILKENTGLAASGEIILAGEPELNNVIKTILTSASESQAKRNSKALPGSSGTPEIQQYQNAINTMINVIVGPLNRIGTQARTAGRLAAEKLDIANRYEIAMDVVVADSKLALQVIDKLEKRRATKGIGPFRLPRDMYDEMFSLGIRIGKYAEADREDTYKSWDEYVIDGADAVDGTVEDARSTLRKIGDQTIEMLGLGR